MCVLSHCASVTYLFVCWCVFPNDGGKSDSVVEIGSKSCGNALPPWLEIDFSSKQVLRLLFAGTRRCCIPWRARVGTAFPTLTKSSEFDSPSKQVLHPLFAGTPGTISPGVHEWVLHLPHAQNHLNQSFQQTNNHLFARTPGTISPGVHEWVLHPPHAQNYLKLIINWNDIASTLNLGSSANTDTNTT